MARLHIAIKTMCTTTTPLGSRASAENTSLCHEQLKLFVSDMTAVGMILALLADDILSVYLSRCCNDTSEQQLFVFVLLPFYVHELFSLLLGPSSQAVM